METYFCCWKHICCRLGIFFYRSTLEKYYQMSHSGPWSRTHGITCRKINETFWRRPLFSKNVFKIFLTHVHLFKFSFLNILNTYRVSSNYFWLHWVLDYSIIVSRIKKKDVKCCENFVFVCKLWNSHLFILCTWVTDQGSHLRTKDHWAWSPLFELWAKYLSLELETYDYRGGHKAIFREYFR